MRGLICLLVCALLLTRTALGFTISFDYSQDTNDFFDGLGANAVAAKASLEAAAAFYESVVTDDLLAIAPNTLWRTSPPPGIGEDMWQASWFNPSTGALSTHGLLTVPADTIIVYVGARLLGVGELGSAGPGGKSYWTGTPFETTVRERGEGSPTDIAGATEYAPWGGHLAVDLDSTWNFDHTVAPGGSQNDLYSTLLHELGHVLGIGTANSWATFINNDTNPDQFTGVAAVAEFGSAINLDGDTPSTPDPSANPRAHWANGTMSTEYGGGAAQEAALDPDITVGTRKIVTDLDVAALDDIGWDLAPIPEPSSALLVALSIGLGMCRRTRRRS